MDPTANSTNDPANFQANRGKSMLMRFYYCWERIDENFKQKLKLMKSMVLYYKNYPTFLQINFHTLLKPSARRTLCSISKKSLKTKILINEKKMFR